MTAIGVIILLTQILPAVGYYPKEDATYVNQFKPQAEEIILENILKEEAGEGILVLENFKETIKRAGTITDADIYKEFGFKRITTAVPSTLVALVVMSGIAIGMGLDYQKIEEIPYGFPTANLQIFTGFDIGALAPYIVTAFLLSLLGAIDSLLTSVVADNMTKTQHNPNKELVGQGIGNSIAAIFGGIPGAGATIRTVVNINAGGKTRLSGMIAGVLLLVIMLAFSGIASLIPAAVLAGIFFLQFGIWYTQLD